MSVRVMTAVWEIDLPDSEKLVLLALADCANDEGFCWPSMATLARKCSKSDRTVQAAIKALCAAGHLTRNEVVGKGCNYTVHPRKDKATPEAASAPKRLRGETTSPPKSVRATPEAASDKPSKNHHTPSEGKPSSGVKRALRLPDDFVMPEDWIDWAMHHRKWSRQDACEERDAFIDFWHAKAGKDAAKLDWAGTWRNWARNSRRQPSPAKPRIGI